LTRASLERALPLPAGPELLERAGKPVSAAQTAPELPEERPSAAVLQGTAAVQTQPLVLVARTLVLLSLLRQVSVLVLPRVPRVFARVEPVLQAVRSARLR
jgi:hypothetical protein